MQNAYKEAKKAHDIIYQEDNFDVYSNKNNLKVFVFATEKAGEINKAKEIGADYICSNFPDKI